MHNIVAKLESIEADYRPVPFWSWNDRLDPEELKKQIHWMKDKGIGGFIMHARGGLKTEYLSKDWMEAIKICAQEGADCGMKPWIYDENGWPSGFAGGKLLENAEYRDMYIEEHFGDYCEDADVSYLITDSKLIRVFDGQQSGTYLNLYLKRSVSTVDILNPKVVRHFMELTHEAYLKEFGDDFASQITGFFTDEPQYYRAATPYTAMINNYFQETYGEDILDQLGLLFVEKDGYETFRYRYWLGLQKLMLENFSKQVYEWCEKHDVLFTGHYIEETSLGGQMLCCAGVMPFYEYLHIPGIDWLGPITNNELPARQLTSAAMQLGKSQTITETFGCCGWNISPAKLKRIAGFQFACGLNLMCHHLFPYSEHGQRKKDYPAHFNPANPWIPEYFNSFNDYFSRLGYLLSNSTEAVSVAILHPVRSAYLTYKRGNNPNAIPVSELDESLRTICRMFSSRGIAFHFLDETLLEKHGFVRDAKIGCGNCTYDYVVLPKLYTMSSTTEQLLHEYMEHHGKILLMDEKPCYLEGIPYDYGYLDSNCTLEEIEASQPFSVSSTENELYYTYRHFEDQTFLFVQNTSDSTDYAQTFHFKDESRSFSALNLNTLEFQELPLTVTLGKNESLLLFTSKENVQGKPQKKSQILNFRNSHVDFSNNFLTLDQVRYSKDGLTFSNPVLCHELCDQLLKERYEGTIYLRYEFEVRKIPETLILYSEKDSAVKARINGTEIFFRQGLEEDPSVQKCLISEYIFEGTNVYEVECYWHQTEETYYALFGEGVTESLKNCIAYDSEIEPIYLGGHFGVFSDHPFCTFDEKYLLGHEFYIAEAPETVSEPVTDGLPFFRGSLTLTKDFCFEDSDTCIALDGKFLSAKVSVNGISAGEILFENTLDISEYLKKGDNTLQVTFSIGNRNLLGPLHSQGSEYFVSPNSFQRSDFKDAATGKIKYKFLPFYSTSC